MEFNKEEFKQIIDKLDFDRFIGKTENEWFECKKSPYRFDDDRGKIELAKDITSFANKDGGYIILGLNTNGSAKYLIDQVKELVLFEQNLIAKDQYTKIIRDWIYPKIENIDIKWIASKGDRTRGLGVIEIPPQKDTLKPFLMVKTLNECESGKAKLSEKMFGYAERIMENSQPLEARDIQIILRNGLNFEKQLKDSLDNIVSLIQNVNVTQKEIRAEPAVKKSLPELNITATQTHKVSNVSSLDSLIRRRIVFNRDSLFMRRQKSIILIAYTQPLPELKNIFDFSKETSIKNYLEHPPTLRYGGWDLKTLSQAQIIKGEMLRVGGRSKRIDLYPDGMLIFSAFADETFLAYGEGDKQKINPVALIEATFSFMNLYKTIMENFEAKPEKVFIGVNLNNMHYGGGKSYLCPYGIHSFSQMSESDKKEAPENTCTRYKSLNFSDFDAGRASYILVRDIYLWFGFDESKIPYVMEDGGVKKIDHCEIGKI